MPGRRGLHRQRVHALGGRARARPQPRRAPRRVAALQRAGRTSPSRASLRLHARTSTAIRTTSWGRRRRTIRAPSTSCQSGWLGTLRPARPDDHDERRLHRRPLEAASGVALLLVPHVTAGAVADPNTTLGELVRARLPPALRHLLRRVPSGSPAVGGVQIRLVQTPGSALPIQTQLLDTNPADLDLHGRRAGAGRDVHRRTDSITITTTDVNPLGATVQVTIGATGGAPAAAPRRRPPDTTPRQRLRAWRRAVASGPVVSLAFGPRPTTARVASYRVTRDGAQIDNVGCERDHLRRLDATYGTHTYGVTPIDSAGQRRADRDRDRRRLAARRRRTPPTPRRRRPAATSRHRLLRSAP